MIFYLTSQAAFAQGVPRSDTLFGAICWAIRWLYGEKELAELLAAFDASVEKQTAPPFVISSVFPFFEDYAGKILFLPRPLGAIDLSDSLQQVETYQSFKRFQKAKFVSRSVFDLVASGKLDEAQIYAQLNQNDVGSFRLHGGALMTQAEYERVKVLPSLISAVELPRNSINRISVATSGTGGQLFYQPVASGRALSKLNTRSGFYFLARSAESATTEMLKAAMRFLADKGLGGDFSVGRGHCEVSADSDDIVGDTGGTRLMTLSLMHPSPTDLQHLNQNRSATFARLERRKGFLEGSFVIPIKQIWKPTLFMLGEGSTFLRDGERNTYGNLFAESRQREGLGFDVRINGLAYTVGMKGGEKQ
ncbi:MAG TPA: type III-A CRISPR-associated RAMP protein Csm4 [Blastocatellia bacterium]|nr:type III-A CRISPR-associated RAMP protein Csm4 [Blastocatellia bacterium]